MQRDTSSTRFPLGSALPQFCLKATNDSLVTEQYFQSAKAALVVFSCNHCPYVKGTDRMLIEIAKEFSAQGLKVLSISSNDAEQYPEDGFELMKAKSQSLQLPFPYLYDETQEVAHLFDAACTPECFLFDSKLKLVYQGAMTDRPKEQGVDRKDLLSPAIAAVLEGGNPEPSFNHPIGCSIKWAKA